MPIMCINLYLSINFFKLSALVQYAAESGVRAFPTTWKTVKVNIVFLTLLVYSINAIGLCKIIVCMQCPIQDGGFECGYYVLRYMKHFMEDPTKSINTKVMHDNYDMFSNLNLKLHEIIHYLTPIFSYFVLDKRIDSQDEIHIRRAR